MLVYQKASFWRQNGRICCLKHPATSPIITASKTITKEASNWDSLGPTSTKQQRHTTTYNDNKQQRL